MPACTSCSWCQWQPPSNFTLKSVRTLIILYQIKFGIPMNCCDPFIWQKSVANFLIFRIRKVLGGLNNSYLAISPCINCGKQITNAQFNLQSALLTCLETWTMSPKLGLLNPIMIPYQLQRIQPSLAFIIGKARQRVRPQFRWFGFPLSSISLKLNGNNKGHF